MPLIPFIFPINVYLIGDSIGTGLQFLLVRLLDTSYGWSVFPLWRELEIVIDGLITGRSAFSILLWIFGAILLGTAAVLLMSNRGNGRRNVMVYGMACALLMISTMVQYGPFFNGPAGVAIPIGLPLLVVIGYYLWKDANRPESEEEGDGDVDELDEAPNAEPLAASGSSYAIAEE